MSAEHAPAKINLALHVTGQRADRYHFIDSLSVFTAFGDGIAIKRADRDAFSVTGPFALRVPDGADNLVIKARDGFRAAYPDCAGQRLAIALEKNIPAVSGVGGGSSDAAATLRALARLFGVDRDADRLAALAPSLGADVPMCLMARPLIASGIGEVLQPVTDFPVLHLVLANPGVAVPTPRVFAALHERHNTPLPQLPPGMDAAMLAEWLRSTRNDLFEPARSLAPSISDALAAITAEGAVFARMSGSGATCFGLFADAAKATRAAKVIGQFRPGWFVTATHTTA